MTLSEDQNPYTALEAESVHYGPEPEWMRRLVLVAKHTVVWLAQLSARYGRPVHRLDEIPDEALEELAARGFSGLWLVGLWQRSPVSQKIKRMLGQHEADASAYAIVAYETAAKLGGEAALDDLRRRAAKVGIRLAADMIPNHTGMDHPWMVEHPERYIATSQNPIQVYSFTGANLSDDPRVELYLEDHYHDQSDAAVVFKRVDTATGEASFVYHGNDGVGTPWNDTAQLDFLRADVRAAIAEEILDVARRFPIIRFDAAMALARQHVRRLWVPQPGLGDTGWVESRQHHGMSAAEFEAAMPREFWSEVVERVSSEAPDTLLMAEAFWLMEGYFAHNLGLPRVYNSAFMNWLAEENNARFRQNLRDVLDFDARLLARFVNYMSTPDEESARHTFGAGDKYFGVATLLATLPGLPMFTHGQVEGLAERYAMDYATPRIDEMPSQKVIERHSRQIAPLLKRRELFAGTENFHLYDALDANEKTLEDVIAFSNRAEGQRALVLYNNSPAPREGRVGGELVEGLSLAAAKRWQAEEMISGTRVAWEAAGLAEEGLPISLQPYQVRVFWNFRVAN